jgi:ATP-binding cassette subfamily B protein
MRQAQASLLFISQFPRYMIESLGMVLIAVIACLLVLQQGSIVDALPEMGALALGAQRLLPVLQQAYAAWSSISGSQAQLRDTVELLKQPVSAEAFVQTKSTLPIAHGIRLNNVGFRYSPETPWILRSLDLFIRKGERIGFLGVTGSGKSTLLDVVMGLLPPTEGRVEVDGVTISTANLRAWQSGLAHVPQSIFLTDRSVAENIAFGQPKHLIDRERVKNAARRAQLAELIESWPNGYDTVVGERGIRLSGGQRQRIGIARALYKDAQVIVFDEATSALDYETEEAVMKAIEALQGSLTILVIAHRLSTLRMCDRIVEVGKQGILRVGTWDEVVGVSR